jgi:hypothetical protein
VGSLEGTHGLGLYGVPNTRLERPFLDQIHRLPEQFGELNVDARHTQKRYAAGSIESGQQVNVGIRAVIAARRGTEQRQVRDAYSF